MRLVLNIIWLVLAGIWIALAYVLAGAILCITIIGIPFGWQSFKLAGYALWPFGRALVPASTRMKAVSAVANVLWFILAGWWLALGHLFTGIESSGRSTTRLALSPNFAASCSASTSGGCARGWSSSRASL